MRYNGNNTKGKYTHHENQIQIYWKENIQDRVTREIFKLEILVQHKV